MHGLIRRDRFGPHFHLLNYFSSFIWGWLRPWRIPSVTAAGISIVRGNNSPQNGREKFKIPSIKKIVFLLHTLSQRDGLITASLLPPPPHPHLSLSLSVVLLFVQCCRFLGALQIENSEETDQGKYECVASNMEGVRYSSPANLYVRGREQPVPRARAKMKKLLITFIKKQLKEATHPSYK